MIKCKKCGKDIEFNHIRGGMRFDGGDPIQGFSSVTMGYYCPDCDLYYDTNLEEYRWKLTQDAWALPPVWIRIGKEGEWKKAGLYCNICGTYHHPDGMFFRINPKRSRQE